MEEKNGLVPGSPANTETDHLGSEHPEKGMSQEMSTGGGGGGSVSTGTDLVVKRKRGRPRKYDVAADVAGHVPSSPVPAFSESAGAFSDSNLKRGRGRPRGSGKLQLLASLGGFADTAGGNFTPHVINVQAGEDVFSRIISFAQKGPRAVCILSATGVVSSVVIRQPGSSGGYLRCEGRFEILSLKGSFMFSDVGGNHRSGMLSISLAKPDGKVFGGGVASSLIAAGPIQQDISKELDRRRYSADSSSATSLHANSELVRVPIQVAQTTDHDDSCVTLSSALLEPPVLGGAVNAIAANRRMNPTTLQMVEMNPLPMQASQAIPEQIISSDINTNLPLF